jgi:peptide methionine sulfoxide reductase msrA/msrB
MNWKDVQQIMKNNPAPPMRVEKTSEEWKRLLTPEQYRVTRLHGTERAFSGEYCEAFSPGVYNCACCGTELFDSTVKFDSGTGWPSFTGPVKDNVVKYQPDNSYGMHNVEVLCNVCDAHLGHVFPDGPKPSGLRFCINSVSLKKEEVQKQVATKEDLLFETTTLGGGCFWCTEAILNELDGVTKVISGYSGGHIENPTYSQISNGDTGHAEVVQVQFDPKKISYADLLRLFLATHNPTSLNRQGADVGSQYRSIILFHSETQHQTAREIIEEMQAAFDKPIVTELVPFSKFFKAEQSHQDYYRNNPEKAYCQAVITPKLQKLRAHFATALKKKPVAQD